MFKLAVPLILVLALNFGGQDPTSPPIFHDHDQDSASGSNPEMERQEIINLEHEAARAIQTNTGTFFRRVYSEDFAGTLSRGQAVDRTTFITAVQTSEVKYNAFNASDISVRLYKDAAIATCMWSASGTFKGQSFSSQMRVTHVYINTPRGWRVVSGQITTLPPGAQQPL